MAKSSGKKKSGGKKKGEKALNPEKASKPKKASKAASTARPMTDDNLSAALDVAGEALEMIGRIASEAAGRLRALAEAHRRQTATDDEE
jgi:hypothetical protein